MPSENLQHMENLINKSVTVHNVLWLYELILISDTVPEEPQLFAVSVPP
jgi:hypothetical protein